MSGYLVQSLAIEATAPSLTWRQDTALAVPELRFPIDGARYCPEIIRQYGQWAGITLSWDAVTSASFYVVQLCTDQSFRGSTVIGVRVVTNECDLNYIEHISLSQRIYWRVSAYSANGGSSAFSKVRYLAIECPDSSGVDYKLEDPGATPAGNNLCDQAGVDISIIGPDQVRKSETERGWVLNVNFDCKAFGNQALEIQDIQWEIDQSSSEPVTVLTPAVSDPPEDKFVLTASVSSTRVESFEIEVAVTFAYGAETFECRQKKRVLIEGEGSTGGGSIYIASLDEVDCTDKTAVGYLVKGPCGESLSGDPVDIEDELGCFLTGPAELLVGKRAFVTKMSGETKSPYTTGCPYVIINMCCDTFSC